MSDTPTTTATEGDASGVQPTETPTTAPTSVEQPNWAEFTSGLERLNAQLGGKLDTLVTTVQTATETPAAPAEPVDLEAMSRPELVAHIVGTISEAVRSQISEALSPVTSQLNGLQQSVTERQVQSEIATLQSSHKDFGDWKGEMIELAKVHGSLGVRQLYALARAENPDKAKTLDAKYTPPTPPPPPRWGGLTNTGGANGAPVKVDARQAGIDAYREVSQRHPGILAALENI